MYSDKKNINILTALLLKHKVDNAVVCPGSRNAALVHNLNQTGEIKCFPVTDERSAAFYAIGLSLSQDCMPVAVCVTSGTALLNMAPAVAEAWHRNIPLILISADRPRQWVGQLDGQTMEQQGALGTFVAKSVTLPEPEGEEEEWMCQRLVNEAMIAARKDGGRPVHINVPVSEPLFCFNCEDLPQVRPVCHYECDDCRSIVEWMHHQLKFYHKPMVVFGQIANPSEVPDFADNVRQLSKHAVVLYESLSHPVDGVCRIDEALCQIGDDKDYYPDFIVYIGGNLVGKRLKSFLRKAKAAETWIVTPDGELHDVTMSTTMVIKADARDFVKSIQLPENDNEPSDYVRKWNTLLREMDMKACLYEPSFSQMLAVKYFEEQFEDMEYDFSVHYANSFPVRLANIFADHYVYCNRGVNGIEGSLSTAVGHSADTSQMVFCVIGDLSFFYDQNALWNANMKGNLRIMLLNNSGGAIFGTLNGLADSPVANSYIAAHHNTEAQGICTQNDIGYLKATNVSEMRIGIVRLMTAETNRPLLLEVFTDRNDDLRAFKEYFEHIRK